MVNVDVPSSVAGYVHRVGRTGRAGEAGTAVSLLAPEDAEFAAELEQQLTGAAPGSWKEWFGGGCGKRRAAWAL